MGVYLPERVILQKESHCREYFFKKTSKYFFWGHPLTEVYQDELFLKLPASLGSFSYFYEVPSVLAMLALRDNLSARLVQAILPTKDCRHFIHHGWTEFIHCGRWWVVDFAGLHACFSPLLRSSYYAAVCPSSKTVYRYHRFWNYPNSVPLDHYLKCPKTSRLFSSFYAYFGDQSFNDKSLDGLGAIITKLMNDPNAPTIKPEITSRQPRTLIY